MPRTVRSPGTTIDDCFHQQWRGVLPIAKEPVVEEDAGTAPRTELIEVELPNGTRVRVEAAMLGGEHDVAAVSFNLDGVMNAIEGIAEAFTATMERVRPNKATVSFSLEIGVETGQLTSIFVKGSSKGNLEVALEWSHPTVPT